MTGRLQEKNGRCYMILNIRDDKGSYKQKWFKTGLPVKNNRRKAEVMLRNKINEYSNIQIETAMISSVSDFLNGWLMIKRLNVQPSTIEIYKIIINYHMIPFFNDLGKNIVDISPCDIQQYFVSKLNDGLSPNTIVKHQTILRGAFCYAVQQGLIPFNPLDRVLAPKKVESVVKYFTNEQLELILSKVSGTTIEPAVYIAIYSGFRRGEVLGVKWKAVDFTKGIITMNHTVTKCGSKIIQKDGGKNRSSIRSVYLSEPLKLYLSDLRKRVIHNKDDDYICMLNHGKLMAPDYLTGSFKAFLIASGLPPYTFHTLRHSSATYLLSKGHQLKDIQAWLGHKKLESTNRYAHLQVSAMTDMAKAFTGLKIIK